MGLVIIVCVIYCIYSPYIYRDNMQSIYVMYKHYTSIINRKHLTTYCALLFIAYAARPIVSPPAFKRCNLLSHSARDYIYIYISIYYLCIYIYICTHIQ